MQVLDENETNFLVHTDDGTATKTKASNLNKLLFGHNLAGLLQEGSEVWSINPDGEPRVTVIPDENAECYTIRIEDAPQDLNLGKHHKTDLVDVLAEVYQEHDGESVKPLLRLYEDVRENMVRDFLLDQFQKVFGDRVEVRDQGWFINGHLLLTFENEFYHSEAVSRNRSGSVIGEGMSIEAYGLQMDDPAADINRRVSYDGEDYRLTDAEMEFLGRAMWAIEETPDRRD